MLIRRLIIKFYLLLVATVAVLGLSIDYFLESDHQANQQADFKLEVLRFDDINIENTKLEQLKSGELLSLALKDRDLLLRKLPDSETIVQVEIPLVEEEHTTWIAAFYLLLALPILLWFWPLAIDLNQLELATKAIGQNKFHHRIRLKPQSAIESISRTFNAMAARIEYLIKEQRSLTSAVSHEIRTPLARLKFALELQKKQSHDSQEQKQIEAMQADVDELTELVDEMLSYAKLDNVSAPIELQDVPANAWLATVIDECQKNNSQISIDVQCEVEVLRIDPHLMARALSNLVLNAFRFAKHKISIELIEVKVTNIETSSATINKTLQLSVTDDGPGIPLEQRERLFEPFAKMDQSRTEQAQGHGLGLAIVKRIIEKHCGTITIDDSVTNAVESGARFVICLPQH